MNKRKTLIVTTVVIALIVGGVTLINAFVKGNIEIPINLVKVDREQQIEKFVLDSIYDMGGDVNFKKIYDEEYKKVITKKEYITMTSNLLVDAYYTSLKEENNNPLKINEKELEKEKIQKLIREQIETDFNE